MIFYCDNDIDKKIELLYGSLKETMMQKIINHDEFQAMDELATIANKFMKEKYPDDFNEHNIRGFFSLTASNEVFLALVIQEKLRV